MDRAEKYGLGVAAAGHVLLFGLLSVGFLSTPNPLKLESRPIDISLVDEVALESTSPATTEAPAPSEAPDTGPPEDAAPVPTEAPPEPVPAPPPPAPTPPRPVPPRPEPPRPAPPKPAPKAAPAPAKPAPKAAPKPPAKAEPKAAPKAAPAPASKAPPSTRRSSLAPPNVTPERSGSDARSKSNRPRGSLLGDDFRKSLATSADRGTGQTARTAKVSATAVAGLGDAIARQVQPCANRIPNPGPGANRIRSKLRIRMDRDGSLAARPNLTGQSGVDDENTRYAQRVGELAAAAVIQCAPYKLPAELYEGGWEDIIINYRLPG